MSNHYKVDVMSLKLIEYIKNKRKLQLFFLISESK